MCGCEKKTVWEFTLYLLCHLSGPGLAAVQPEYSVYYELMKMTSWAFCVYMYMIVVVVVVC